MYEGLNVFLCISIAFLLSQTVMHTENVARGQTDSFQNVRGCEVYNYNVLTFQKSRGPPLKDTVTNYDRGAPIGIARSYGTPFVTKLLGLSRTQKVISYPSKMYYFL